MQLIIPIILDAIVIFTIIFCVIFSYKKGFLRSILSIIDYVVSFFVAGFVGRFIANLIFDNLMSSYIQDNIANTLYNAFNTGNLSGGLAEISNMIPGFLTSYFLEGKTVNDVAGVFIAHHNIEAAANAITTQIVKPCSVVIISVLVFFILFILCHILFRFFYKLTGVLNKVPIAGMVNGLFGGLCGVVKAGIFLFVIAIFVWVLILLTQDKLNWMNTSIINDTHLFFMFYKFIPFN